MKFEVLWSLPSEIVVTPFCKSITKIIISFLRGSLDKIINCLRVVLNKFTVNF